MIIEEVVDKTGEKVIIYNSDTLVSCPALPLMLKVYSELMDHNMASQSITFNNSSRIVWAERKDGTVVGGICYEYKSESRCGWLILSFTKPEERGKGINALVHKIYENDCKKLGATHLSSFVNLNNKSRLESLKSVGMIPQMYKTYKKL